MLFDKFQNRTIIKGTLEAVDPIHIGASEKNSLNPTEIIAPALISTSCSCLSAVLIDYFIRRKKR